MTFLRGFFASIAGPNSSYDLQRNIDLHGASERGAYMKWVYQFGVCFIPRYLTGFLD